ncbi:phenylacrylic acid decarboxylase [Aspergillus bertholletiae]|uniref:Flavin prenyltransferase PAD1, mitochondrial n=1 Tax=Aspergillus bertholletiae TaxID=1226010 RepID=A0A5N7B8B2_9EURO|nr:phenylacrylic acid decarboxylase [Aspergillus bertholletiae]
MSPLPRCSPALLFSTRSPSLQRQSHKKRIVLGITGATGGVYAIRMLEQLRAISVETHLIMSKWAMATMKYETLLSEEHVRSLSSVSYSFKDMSASIASGSFLHDGMVIVPCSMKTLAAVRTGLCDDLISRAADVTLKEQRKLTLVVRETPLSDIHLENMLALRRAGATIFPPVPAFYTRPQSLSEMVDQTVGRILDSLDIHTNDFERWNGMRKTK